MLSCGDCHIVRSPPLAKIRILRISIKPATDSTLKPASWTAPEPATSQTIERHTLAAPYDRHERIKSARSGRTMPKLRQCTRQITYSASNLIKPAHSLFA